jgi:hypothetical protein
MTATTPSPVTDEMCRRAAKAVQRHHAWSSFWSCDDAKQLVETGLKAALDGMVVVRRSEDSEK